MELIIPSRNKPTTGSFPTSPRKVRQWIAGLYPVTSANSTQVLVRGLKHSNRLENTINQRADILECFRPVVRELIDFAVNHYAGQNLPLDNRELNSFNTVTTLLQEMAFGCKIIVSDCLAKHSSANNKYAHQALRLAMELLDELALRYLQIYRDIPRDVWRDYNTLFRIAETWNISDKKPNKSLHVVSATVPLEQLFVETHLMAMSSSFSLRRGQILQLHKFIAQHSELVEIVNPHQREINGKHLAGVDLCYDSPASTYLFLDAENSKDFRVLVLDKFLDAIENEVKTTPTSVSALYEADVLTQESLMRLQKNFSVQNRLHARQYFNQPLQLVLGLKEIYASLHYLEHGEPVERGPDISNLSLVDSGKPAKKSANSDYITHPGFTETSSRGQVWEDVQKHVQPGGKKTQSLLKARSAANTDHWHLINRSIGGLGLLWDGNHTPHLSVGEIVAYPRDAGNTQLSEWVLGQTCWIRTSDQQKLYAGITHIAKEVTPVLVERTKGSHNSVTTQTECLIAKLIGETLEDCIVVPAYMFHTGEIVSIRVDDQIVRYRLLEKIHATGSFALFTLEAFGSSLTADGLSKQDAAEFGLLDDKKSQL